jgi:ABC-type branched-subunit amino acid transport system permease subunit
VLALLVAGLVASMVGFVTSFLVLRGTDLTRIMVTLGVAFVLRELANQNGWLTGGADGLQGVTMKPILGMFRFDMFGTTATSIASPCCSFCSCWRGASSIRRSGCRSYRSRTIRCARRPSVST